VNVPASPREGIFTVLARQRLERFEPVPVGEPVTVTAWPISNDGRKHLCGAAIHARDGTVLTRAESLLVEVPKP
jgi:acyl-CoA thioesterase FadM